MPVLGMSASVATLTGNALGSNKPQKAKTVVWVCLSATLLVWTLIALFTLLGRYMLADIYSDDAEIHGTIRTLLTIMVVAGFCDATQNVMAGALSGMGLQKVAGFTYMFSFYGLMLPCACVAVFSLHLGVAGM